MEVKETVQKLLQEMIVPDLARIKEENGKILVLLDLTNKRLDDVNTHLVDQSRRIDEVRSNLSRRIDEVRSELNQKIDEVRIELSRRLNNVHSDMVGRIDANNARIDLFFKDSASRSDQKQLEERMAKLEHEVAAMKQQIAA
jgi:exonuclease VII large subunit